MFINKYFSSFFKKNDWTLIVAVLLLIILGLLAIYSVALGQGGGEFLNFKKQLAWLAAGSVLLLIFANIDYHFWQRLSWLGYLFSLLLLILVLTPLGSTIRGTQGWFNLGLFSFQPVELTKIFLILALADIYRRYSRTLHKFVHLIVIGLIVLLPLGLVLLQPDFGSGMVLFFTWLISFFSITKNKWHLAAVVTLMILAFTVSWFFIFQDYQKDRINTFLHPENDPLGEGYNVSQSIIAVGAGRLLGRGLGFGSQSQLKFIPESQTDFIFAVIAEELGFLGVTLLLGLYGLIFYRCYKIAARAPDDYGLFLAFLVAVLVFIHLMVNVGMGIGLLPVTGISLPFVSYGGSFLVTSLFLISLCLNVHKSSLTARKA